MADEQAKDLLTRGGGLFSKKFTLLSLWQEMNENFYPERADYTINRYLGQEFAANLVTSYPILVRRNLHGQISGMLRPNDKEWFETTIFRDDLLDKQGKQYLEMMEGVQRRAMYDRVANLIRATKECDGDFVTIGNGIIQATINRKKQALMYHCRHPRDCAWAENDEGRVDEMHRDWKPTNREATSLFKNYPNAKLHPKIADAKDQHAQCHIRHVMLPSEEYDSPRGGKRFTKKYTSIWIDVNNGSIVLEEPSKTFQYVVPRWQTVSGSQYAFSPCTVAGLPDARLIQAMTLVLLEAGEKAANPPVLATQDVVRSDINLYSGGVTWVDRDYDEKMGASLKLLEHDNSGIPLTDKMREDVKAALNEAFYLDKLGGSMPIDKPDMTAFEVGQHVQNYIRQALPLFEPMEQDYNGELCSQTFDLLQETDAFGSIFDMPASLRKADVQFKFKSALHDTIEQQRGPTFLQAKELIAAAAEMDPSAGSIIDVKKSIRWALEGMQYPQDLQNSEEQVAKIAAATAKQQDTTAQINNMQHGAMAAQQVGLAGQELQKMQQQPGQGQ